jgi:putative transferase (TIGR04331 family)
MLLVTTALEQTWGREEELLFLGEWCKRYNRRNAWASRGTTVLPYHWDDRAKLRADFQYLQKLNRRLLAQLTESLNTLHCVHHNARYWNILLGYWLTVFSGVVYDRWEMVRRAEESGQELISLGLRVEPDAQIPNGHSDFVQFITEDLWNHAIYVELIRGWTKIPVQDISEAISDKLYPEAALPAGSAQFIKRIIRSAYDKYSHWVGRGDKAFVISTSLPLFCDISLQLGLGQVPKFWRAPNAPYSELNMDMRQWRLESPNGDRFGQIVRALIPRQIPRIFVEGYSKLCRLTGGLHWPKNPKLIFTSNSHFSDPVFKAWAAERTESGSLLLIGEHGGFGPGAFNAAGSYQLSIADALISWGWDDCGNKTIRPFGILPVQGRTQRWNSKGTGLMVQVAMPRYGYDLRSMVIAGQMLDYFEQQFRFMEKLPQTVRNAMRVRTMFYDYGWCQKQRWRDRFPSVNFDEDQGIVPIASAIRKARIVISTYCATTYLESLALNVPTIMFWNESHWEADNRAMPFFEMLKEAEIFHATPESAASKLTEIWEDIPAWWNEVRVQKARKKFCDRYARLPDRPAKELKHLLRRIAGRVQAAQ